MQMDSSLIVVFLVGDQLLVFKGIPLKIHILKISTR